MHNNYGGAIKMRSLYYIIFLLCISTASAFSMSSASFKEEGIFNSGVGNITSTSYHIYDAIGEIITGYGNSSSYHLQDGIFYPAEHRM